MKLEKSIKIRSNNEIAPGTYLMELLSAEIASDSKPGQFVMIRVEKSSDPLLRRPFSICAVEGSGIVKILYKVVGKGTEILSNKNSGDFLSILGPLGSEFKIPESGQNTILVAGGIGIAPIFFLGQNIKYNNLEFLAGFRTFDEIIKVEDISSVLGFDTSIATDDGSFGYRGRVTDLLEETLKRHQDRSNMIYACGPLPMLRQTVLTAQKYNLPCQVSIEAFMACGLGVCQGCAIKVIASEPGQVYQRVCMEGPVFDADNIDWASL